MDYRLHVLAVLLLLALVLPPLGNAMPAAAADSGECPSHGVASEHDHAPSGQVGDAAQRDCSSTCLLTCALAGLTAGMPALSAFPPVRPERFSPPATAPWQPFDDHFELFRPPKPGLA